MHFEASVGRVVHRLQDQPHITAHRGRLDPLILQYAREVAYAQCS